MHAMLCPGMVPRRKCVSVPRFSFLICVSGKMLGASGLRCKTRPDEANAERVGAIYRGVQRATYLRVRDLHERCALVTDHSIAHHHALHRNVAAPGHDEVHFGVRSVAAREVLQTAWARGRPWVNYVSRRVKCVHQACGRSSNRTGTGSGMLAPRSSDSFISCGHTTVGMADADAVRVAASANMRIIRSKLQLLEAPRSWTHGQRTLETQRQCKGTDAKRPGRPCQCHNRRLFDRPTTIPESNCHKILSRVRPQRITTDGLMRHCPPPPHCRRHPLASF